MQWTDSVVPIIIPCIGCKTHIALPRHEAGSPCRMHTHEKENMGIRLKDLSKLGYRDNVARSLAVAIVGKHCKHQSKEQIIKTLSDVLENPDTYKENETWGKLAEHLSPTLIEKKFTAYDLLEEPLPYKTYGGKFIETLAKQQMNLAMRLPVSVAGALMPDAHAGYGLPIGGVLATDNAVIPTP